MEKKAIHFHLHDSSHYPISVTRHIKLALEVIRPSISKLTVQNTSLRFMEWLIAIKLYAVYNHQSLLKISVFILY